MENVRKYESIVESCTSYDCENNSLGMCDLILIKIGTVGMCESYVPKEVEVNEVSEELPIAE